MSIFKWFLFSGDQQKKLFLQMLVLNSGENQNIHTHTIQSAPPFTPRHDGLLGGAAAPGDTSIPHGIQCHLMYPRSVRSALADQKETWLFCRSGMCCSSRSRVSADLLNGDDMSTLTRQSRPVTSSDAVTGVYKEGCGSGWDFKKQHVTGCVHITCTCTCTPSSVWSPVNFTVPWEWWISLFYSLSVFVSENKSYQTFNTVKQQHKSFFQSHYSILKNQDGKTSTMILAIVQRDSS